MINSKIAVYVICVDDKKYDSFVSYMSDYNITNINRLPCKIFSEQYWIGTGLSHKDCVRHAQEHDYDNAIVFEDDARFVSGFNNLDSLIDELYEIQDWEYACLSSTLLYKINPKKLGQPNVNAVSANTNISFTKLTSNITRLNVHNIEESVVGNSSGVIYNKRCYNKYLTEFDPHGDVWCDTWPPINLNTVLVTPPVVYQHDKPWMIDHYKIWGKFLQS